MAFFDSILGGSRHPQGSIISGAPGEAAMAPPRIPWRQNPMVTMAGLSLLGAPTLQQGLQNVGRNAPVGIAAKSGMQEFMMKRDEAARAKAEQDAQAARNRNAWNVGLRLKSGVITWDTMSPEDRATLEAVPEIGMKLFPEQVERWESLTDPEARLAAGISADDARTAQHNTTTGEVKFPGGGGTTINVGGETLTPGAKKADEIFAQEYVDWTARGGFADVEKQLMQLEEAATRLATEKGLTGPAIGAAPDWALVWAQPEAVEVREAVEEVVQRNLRLVLGAQFTEREGERLIARAYNPSLPQEENAKRVRRLIQQIGTAAETKQSAADYFAEHGTLRGWTGKLPTITDIEAAIGSAPTTKPSSGQGGAPVYTSPSGVKVYPE